MEASFDFGMIGIGVMGSNLLLNMADHGFSVMGFDLKQERVDQLEAAALIVSNTTWVKAMSWVLPQKRCTKCLQWPTLLAAPS